MRNDPIGSWFEWLEENGEWTNLRFGRVSPHGGVVWEFLSHVDYDGISGFRRILSKYGLSAEGPSSRRASRLRLSSGLDAIFHRSIQSKREYDGWPTDPAAWHPRCPFDSRPNAIAWSLFDDNETKLAYSVAEDTGISLNSWLLSALQRAIADELEQDHGRWLWIVPVAVRNKALRRYHGNHISFLNVELRASEDPRKLHDRIHYALNRQEYIAARDILAYSAKLGKLGMASAMRTYLSMGQTYVGVMSSFGKWRQSYGLSHDDRWLAVPPPTRWQPLAAGTLVWNNRLSLTMQVHPSIQVYPERVDQWVRNWRALALKERRS